MNLKVSLQPSSLEAAGDLVSGEGEEETVEYDKNADAIQAEMDEALGGSSVEEVCAVSQSSEMPLVQSAT